MSGVWYLPSAESGTYPEKLESSCGWNGSGIPHGVSLAKEGQNQRPTGKLTLRIVIGMTTPGAIFLSAFAPAVLGLLLAAEQGSDLPSMLVTCLLAIPCLLNASVNVLNDYFDYVRGNDTPENIVSEADGPLAFHQVEDPKPAFWIGLLLFAAAACMGIYVMAVAGWKPAVIGVIGALATLTYSGSKVSTSYLPIGEPLAGFVLGGLVPLGVYTALTGHVDVLVLYKSIPMMLIVTQFMLENNTCDLERDWAAGRKTLPILVGAPRAILLAWGLNILWVVQLVHVVAGWYYKGLPILFISMVVTGKSFLATFLEERTTANKTPATLALAKTALGVAVGYPLSILMHIVMIGW